MSAAPAPIIPYLRVAGAAAAIEFYKQAFGATEQFRLNAPGSDTVVHAEIVLRGSRVMLSDDMPEYQGGKSLTPIGLGGSPVSLHLQLDSQEELDALWSQAVAAGCVVAMPLAEQFWGDRFGTLTDPYGHAWSLAATVKVLTGEEMQSAMIAAFSAGGGCGGEPE